MASETLQEKKISEEEFNEWLESVVMTDGEGVPVTPKLVEDKDEGEDSEFEE